MNTFANYGDRNFFENGCLVKQDPNNPTGYIMYRCIPFSDHPDRFQFGRIYVDISDPWINRSEVEQYCGKCVSDMDFAVACTDYYSWLEFGVNSNWATYDWQNTDRKTIMKELKNHPFETENVVFD